MAAYHKGRRFHTFAHICLSFLFQTPCQVIAFRLLSDFVEKNINMIQTMIPYVNVQTQGWHVRCSPMGTILPPVNVTLQVQNYRSRCSTIRKERYSWTSGVGMSGGRGTFVTFDHWPTCLFCTMAHRTATYPQGECFILRALWV